MGLHLIGSSVARKECNVLRDFISLEYQTRIALHSIRATTISHSACCHLPACTKCNLIPQTEPKYTITIRRPPAIPVKFT